jgi:hypothetical protein
VPAARRPRTALLLAGALVLGAAAAALSAPLTALPTSERPFAEKAVPETYRVLDPQGRSKGTATWRVNTAGGNCCEVLVAATRDGRLVEFGGSFPAVSSDQGRTYTEIRPLTPPTSDFDDDAPRKVGGGEGTVVMAPGGDIVGVTWDPYSGDRLQSFFYSAADKMWLYGEMPLHEPFYDREWVAVAKGPFTIRGTTAPWVSMVLSNFSRKVILMSTDGINYFTPSNADLESVAGGTQTRLLTGAPDLDLDYMQGHSETRIVPVPGGGALSLSAVGGSSCDTQYLEPDGSWSCYEAEGFAVDGALHADSRGWLHDVAVAGDEVLYRLSRDGGRTWSSRTFLVPEGASSVESYDFKAHGKLGVTALALHVLKDDGRHQDMVMRLDTRSGMPRHVETYLVGKGDMAFTSGLDVSGLVNGAKSNRFDFASVAVLPDGAIAVAFVDKKYDDPATAVLPRR